MGSKGSPPPTQPTYPQQSQLYSAANQEQPIPFFCGIQQLACLWLSPAMDQRTAPIANSGGKKGGKGSSGNQSLNYYGTIAGIIAKGPCDQVLTVFSNQIPIFGDLVGETVAGSPSWSSGQFRSGDMVDLTPYIASSYFLPGAGGYLKLYWGTETQSADSFLASGAGGSHPAYRGFCYFVARHFLFGQDTGTPPNFSFIMGRTPKVDTSIVASGDNTVVDGQVNPVAAIAELISSPAGGLGLPLSRFDAASWLAIAHAVAQNPGLMFCSPLITSAEASANVLNDLAIMFDGGIRWSPAGLLTVIMKNWGVVPGSTPVTLDARHIIDGSRIHIDGVNFDDVPTAFEVQFNDRDRQFQNNSCRVPNLWAQQFRQVTDVQKISRSHVSRMGQALLIGAQAIRQTDQPRPTLTMQVRPSVAVNADNTLIMPGDKILVDLDPVPGGAGDAQLCLVTERTEGRTGPVKLSLQADTLAPVIPYAPQWVATTPTPITAAPIAHALAIPLPAAFGAGLAVALLATRPDFSIIGFNGYFDTDNVGGSFPQVDQQMGFAARQTLVAGIGTGDATFQLTLTDGATGPDSQLAAQTPETALAAAQDPLLLVFAVLDVNGRVDRDGSGNPKLEFMSVVSRTAVSGATFSYTVLRARKGLPALAWTTAAAVWLVPLANISPITHPEFATLAGSGAPAYFKLLSYNSVAEATSFGTTSLIVPPALAVWDGTVATANVTTPMLAQNAATLPVSAYAGSASPSGDVLTCGITTSGGVVQITIACDLYNTNYNTGATVPIKIIRDGVTLATYQVNGIFGPGDTEHRYFCFIYSDLPSAGTHTYKLNIVSGAITSVYFPSMNLVELKR